MYLMKHVLAYASLDNSEQVGNQAINEVVVATQ